MNPPHIVIVGGGFGGLNAARALAGAGVRVTLLDRHNYHLFQPLLYQVATASLSPGDVASPIRWILRHQKNVEVLLADVREIDPAGRRVVIDGAESIPHDYSKRLVDPAQRDISLSLMGRARAWLRDAIDAFPEMRRRVLLAFEAAEREPDAEAQRRFWLIQVCGSCALWVILACSWRARRCKIRRGGSRRGSDFPPNPLDRSASCCSRAVRTC